MSIETKTTTTKTLKIFGVAQYADPYVKFFAKVPADAKVDISVSQPMRGESGSTVTIIEASWDEG